VAGFAPSAAHFDFFNSLRLLGAGCLFLRQYRGYYTIYDFEIKEMFGDYQTFFACRRSRSFGKNEEGKVRVKIEWFGGVLGGRIVEERDRVLEFGKK